MATGSSALRQTGTALVRAARALMDQQNPRDAAAISYFSLLALFPTILVLIAVANDILGVFDIQKNLLQRIVSLFPVSKDFLDANLNQIVNPAPTLVFSCLGVVIWTSTWVFSFVENALNRTWGVPKRRSFWESRLRSITVVLLGGTILLFSAGIMFVVGKAKSQTTDGIREFVNDPIINGLWSSILLPIGLLLAILVFFCIFKLMPDRRVRWQEALSGAVTSALLWELGSFIFVRLGTLLDFELVYGRMGAIIALMAWVYTSNMIMLFGANFSAQLHRPAVVQDQAAPAAGGGTEGPASPRGLSHSSPGPHDGNL